MKKRYEIGKYWEGKHLTPEVRGKIGAKLKGRVPWNDGIPCTEERKKNIREALAEKKKKNPWKPWNFEKKLTKEHKDNISAKLQQQFKSEKGLPPKRIIWNKGQPRTPKEKKAISESLKRRWQIRKGALSE